jgi:asparagine N-glycosylation enzyme membrane subunit Stt3
MATAVSPPPVWAPHAGLAGIRAVVIALSLALLICGIVFWQLKESRGKPVPAAVHRAGRWMTLIGGLLLAAGVILVAMAASP